MSSFIDKLVGIATILELFEYTLCDIDIEAFGVHSTDVHLR